MLSLFKVRREKKGQGMVEYALLLVLIAVVSIGMLRGTGQQVEEKYILINDSIVGAGGNCWVASELFGGWYVPETVAARYYVNHLAPAWFKQLYLAHGEDFAKTLRQHPEMKPLVRPLFEYFSSQGAKAIEQTF